MQEELDCIELRATELRVRNTGAGLREARSAAARLGKQTGRNRERYLLGGLEHPEREFTADAVGHKFGCRLARVLGKKTRPLARGEQTELEL